MQLQEHEKIGSALIVAGWAVAIGFAQYWFVYREGAGTSLRVWGFGLTIVLMVAITARIGKAVTGYKRGMIIDSRNKISLSRMQIVAWTMLVTAAIITGGVLNAKLSGNWQDLLDLSLNPDLVVLMGISATSFAASPGLLSLKTGTAVDRDELVSEFQAQGYDSLAQERGTVVRYQKPEDARWIDLFRGEELGNGTHLDFGRVQLFYFTLIVLLAYFAALSALFQDASAAGLEFPEIDDALLALIGISHGGYLANKAVSHTQTK